jgi:hypothetical protein
VKENIWMKRKKRKLKKMENESVIELPSDDVFDHYKLKKDLEVEFEYDSVNGYTASAVDITTLVTGLGDTLKEAKNNLLENLIVEFDTYQGPNQSLVGKAADEKADLERYFEKVA